LRSQIERRKTLHDRYRCREKGQNGNPKKNIVSEESKKKKEIGLNATLNSSDQTVEKREVGLGSR